MANHDFNSPCNCSECREITQTHVCLSCQFPNKVSIDGIARWVSDRKGGGDYIFDIPPSPIRDLNCYSCGHLMPAVGYYDSVDKEACQRAQERIDLIHAGKVCNSCNKVEGIDWGFGGIIKLRTYNGQQFCGGCVVEAAKQDNPDPSDKDNKYEFNQASLEWSLARVRSYCKTCGKGYLVAVSERSWRNLCKSCYSQRRTPQTVSDQSK
ncbi:MULTISPECIES: hypothetical protein [unclassified Paenibacillus]|uniref:hypothetical protein n=1 Tax=unclassified Paenibacillus TaxID=185978 RepID=UPI00096D0E32|nr:hypothetical protein BJP50_31465 [Paenibacillus odorifer]